MTTATKPATTEGESTMSLWKPENNAAAPATTEPATRPAKRKSRAQRAAEKAASDPKPTTTTDGESTTTVVPTAEMDVSDAQVPEASEKPTTVKPSEGAGTDASDSTGVAPDDENIAEIIKLEKEADGLTSEADSYRAQAAQRIVREYERGVSERTIASAIGKSPSHVNHARQAWAIIQGEIDSEKPEDERHSFNDAYREAKKKKHGVNSVTLDLDGNAEGEVPFPPWSGQMRELKRLTAEMHEQANAKQANECAKYLTRSARDFVSKYEELSAGQS